MKDDRDVAFAWMRKAESDLENAELCLAAKKSLDAACFHCQQAAEKTLKAFLVANRADFPFIHDWTFANCRFPVPSPTGRGLG
jgi:HEPN domain-containing protein